ncbi:MAG: hypothetical protein CMJ83_19365 [Planctomycetes bacterium]|nr:hypothetical protein [Planctomycetota bacterium]
MKTAALLILLVAASVAQKPLSYEVVLDPTALSYLSVRLRVPAEVKGDLELALPSWHAATRRFRDRSRIVSELRATDGEGRRLEVLAEGGGWRVRRSGTSPVDLSWRIGDTRQEPHSEHYFTKTSALIAGARTFLWVRGQETRPCEVALKGPTEWKVTTPLKPTGAEGRFSALDYHSLIDAPVLMGALQTWSFDFGGTKHDVVVDRFDQTEPIAGEAVVKLLQKICTVQADAFGAPPYDRYVYVFIEGARRSRLRERSVVVGYQADEVFDLAGLVRPCADAGVWARLPGASRPKWLVAPDYSKRPDTEDLWFIDGLVKWFGRRALLEARILDKPAWLAQCGRRVLEHRNDLLARVVSPAAASKKVWDRGDTLDIGLAGEMLALHFDAKIRANSEGKMSLQDVILRLNERFPKPKGYTVEDLRKLLAELTGEDLGEFWKAHVDGVQAHPFDATFAIVGLKMNWYALKVRDPRLRTQQQGRFLIVRGLRRFDPLYAAGLRGGDRIISVNQKKVRNPDEVDAQLARLKPGMKLRVDVRRGGRVKSFRISLQRAVALTIPVDERAGRVVIDDVPPGALRDAGIRVGDVLEKVDNQRIGREQDLYQALRRIRGDVTTLTIKRAGKRKRIKVASKTRTTWRGSLVEDPKAKPAARKLRDGLLANSGL